VHTCGAHLANGEATIKEKNLHVDAKKATLLVRAKINCQLYVFVINFSQMIMIFTIGCDAGLINILQSFVF
jgi:hypothetical protein